MLDQSLGPALYYLATTPMLQYYGTPLINENMSSAANTILNIMAILMIIVFIGCLYAIVVAVFQFIFSRGDEATIKKAGNNIRYVIIGLLIVTLVLFIGPIIARRVQYPGYEDISASNVFTRMGNLIGYTFERTGSVVAPSRPRAGTRSL